MHIVSDVISHRIDDIPFLVALLQHLTLAAILDEAVPTHGNTMNHHELTNGEAICIWLVYLVSQADHRKMTVEEWVGHHSAVLSHLWGAPVPASDFTDDRLSTLLTRLSIAKYQCLIDKRLFENTVCVYDLYEEHIRWMPRPLACIIHNISNNALVARHSSIS